jgi:hypothetical protein
MKPFALAKDRPGTYRVLDWGIFDTLHLLTEGKTDLYYGEGPDGIYHRPAGAS